MKRTAKEKTPGSRVDGVLNIGCTKRFYQWHVLIGPYKIFSHDPWSSFYFSAGSCHKSHYRFFTFIPSPQARILVRQIHVNDVVQKKNLRNVRRKSKERWLSKSTLDGVHLLSVTPRNHPLPAYRRFSHNRGKPRT